MRKTSIKAGIAGGAGYTGGELIRLLLHHPHASIAFVHSQSKAGQKLYEVHTDLLGRTELMFEGGAQCFAREDYDVLFLCVGHGEAKNFLAWHALPAQVRIIDLSQDHRLHAAGNAFAYGLCEWMNPEDSLLKHVANPGCFATAIQLALLPLAAAALLPPEVYITGITGSTGAGQALSASTHFSWRSGNIQAYKTLSHQHLYEIGKQIGRRQTQGVELHFVPWRGDFPRGIFISATLNFEGDVQEAESIFQQAYLASPFVHVSPQPIAMKQVVNTNNAVIQLEKTGRKLVVHCAIDNLLKGASGQAIQNMNRMYDFAPTAGLLLKAIAF